MSFPGYIKSLNLIGKHNDGPQISPKAQTIQASSSVTGDGVAESGGIRGTRDPSLVSPPLPQQNILDERGNSPTKSLWVGNIPVKTTSSELRNLFGKFGVILSTRPQTKYAFVNFETLESAITAFEHYHDKDIFHTGTGTVNIRFTGSLAEAKQAKDLPVKRLNSMAIEAEAAQKQWFQPTGSSNRSCVPESPIATHWPNGIPPTGPKSQRREISPPPLRRGDSYRPAELSRQGSYGSESSYRRRDGDDHRDGQERRRRSSRSSQHYTPVYSPSRSRSYSGSRSSSTSIQRNEHPGDDSPLPWERKRDNVRYRNLVWTSRDRGSDPQSDEDETTLDEPRGVQQIQTASPQASVDERLRQIYIPDSPPSIRLNTPEGEQPDYEPQLGPRMGSPHSWPSELRDHPSSMISSTQPKNFSKSPSMRPIERLRVEGATIRGSSVISSVATSSTKTSTRRKRCHDCKKPGSDLSPLFPCSRCNRGFHSGCGDPKASSCSDKSTFVCGRCLHKRESKASTIPAALQSTHLTKLSESVHLVSPPLSLNREAECSTNTSPRDNSLHAISRDKLTSFLHRYLEDDLMTTENNTSDITNKQVNDSTANIDSMEKSKPHGPLPSVSPQKKSRDRVTNKRDMYKIVTCKWWAIGKCTQPEECCYYAHRNTGIDFPDRKRINKRWTCYEWLNHRCGMSERDCLYTHQDTGLHIWKDGRPSFKHVTCFWWFRGRCKWTSEACKFAHEDTGLYSLDPSEIWQGGQKFTTAQPFGESDRSPETDRGAVASGSLTKHFSVIDQPAAAESRIESPFQQNSSNTTGTSTSRPLLTIETLPSEPLSEHYTTDAAGRPFPASIGAPPGTPNEDSPDKSAVQEYSTARSELRFLHRIPDLPTPGLDDVSMFESRPAGFEAPVIGGKAQSATDQVDSSLKLSIQGGSAMQQDSNSQANNPSVVGSLLSTNSQHSVLHSQPSQTHIEHLSKDPRLQRPPNYTSNVIGSVTKDLQGVSDKVSSEQGILKPQEISNAQPSDEPLRRGVKRCLKCLKTVFGTDICRACTNAGNNSSKTLQVQSVPPSAKALVSKDHSRSIVGLHSTPVRSGNADNTSTAQTQYKNPLKRSADESNMFLKNKRPKSSMVFCSSGSIRPDSFRRASVTKRPIFGPLNTEYRGEHPTLEDLIRIERGKSNGKQMTDRENEKETPSILEDQVSERNKNSDQPLEEVRPDLIPQEAVIRNLDTTDLFSSPPQDFLRTQPNQKASPQSSKKATTSANALSKTVNKPQLPSYELSHWRSSESPELATDNAARLARAAKSPVRPSSGLTRPSTTHQRLHQSDSPVQQRRPLLAQRLSSGETVLNPAKFKWASATTCARCQQKHKKCLHDDGGVLSAEKCRDYVQSRNGKPDTGRAKYEWDLILEAAGLRQDSEIDESSSAAPLTDWDTSESDDDFASALDGDEVDGNEDETEALLDKFPTPRTGTSRFVSRVVSPRKILGTVQSTPNQDRSECNGSSSEDKLRKQGLMVESSSEAEDYMTDNEEPHSRRQERVDPLWVPPKTSRDLFEVAPELNHQRLLHNLGGQQRLRSRPSRKQQWAELRDRQLQERREKFGSPHCEVNRIHAPVVVNALVERVVPPRNSEDRFAVGAVQILEESITFGDFLGAPKMPEISLMSDGERLAFEDGQKGLGALYGRTGRGFGRPMTDEEKWPIRMK